MPEFTKLVQPVIIATKGLPCTGKSEFARLIGQWVKCPVFYIDQFLDAVSLEKGYTAKLLPSPEEAERLHRLAFYAFCKAASDSLQWGVDINSRWLRYNCIVVKSRLDSTFELDRLLQLGRERGCGMILIIEFQVKNEYRYRLRLEHKVESEGHMEWYKPRSWKDIEKAKDDYEAAHNNWDLHLCRLVDSSGDGLPQVTRLVLDPFDDLFLFPVATLPSISQHIINLLVDREYSFVEGRYVAVRYGEVGRYWREKNLRGPRCNRDLCYARKFVCAFKYWEELDCSRAYYCGVCGEHVISGQPAYGCGLCTLTLHKSCAELPHHNELEGYQHIENLRDYPKFLPQQHPCKFCLDGGKPFSYGCNSCKLQSHLKCRVLPTILNHNCHEHSLFMNFFNIYKCNACGIDRRQFGGSYQCYICDTHYDIECLSLVRQGEHEHSGHRHLLKLRYSRDGMEKEEAYWCDICYADIDPQNWFYSCQDCPYFSAHPNCARHSITLRSLQTHPN